MKLSTLLMYAGNPREAADQVTSWERAGLDTVWVAEAYGFDSPTLMGYLAARTETVEIGSAILNIYSRTPSAIAQTAAGLDNVSGGRAVLGLGASGPQVIEGWHGVPYDRPLTRTREVVEIVRAALRRETLDYHGKVFDLPLPAVLAAQKGLNEPRYPTLKGIMGAKKKEIKDVKAADIGVAGEAPQLSVVGLEALPARPPGRILQGDVPTAVKELVRALREDAKAI